MHKDGHARLDFIQNMEYKFIELLSVDFERSPDDVVRQQLSYRYNAMKVCKLCLASTLTKVVTRWHLPNALLLPQSRLAIMQARLQDVNNLVKIKNPSLLLQVREPLSLSPPPPLCLRACSTDLDSSISPDKSFD